MKTNFFYRYWYPFHLHFYACDSHKIKVEENKAIARSFIDSWSTHEVDMLTSLFADDCLYEEVATGRSYSNKKGIAAYMESTISGVPDSEFEIVTLLADDKMAMVEWIWTGTNSVGWPDMGIPATGEYFEVRGTTVMEIENKLITRNSDYWDWNTFLIGIGAVVEEE